MYKLEYYQNGENPKWIDVPYTIQPGNDEEAMVVFRAFEKANPSKIIRLIITV